VNRTSKVLFLTFLFFVWMPCIAQTANTRKAVRQPSQSDQLSRPIDWGEESVRLFTDSNVSVTFKLATSWIPGEDHKGMFRYRMSVSPKMPATLAERIKDAEVDSAEKVERFILRVRACSLFLQLYDRDDFSLRSIFLQFQSNVDNQARINGLEANSAAQMDADDYRRFVGDASQAGNWKVSWTCPEKP
jgi:hypothetical protein